MKTSRITASDILGMITSQSTSQMSHQPKAHYKLKAAKTPLHLLHTLTLQRFSLEAEGSSFTPACIMFLPCSTNGYCPWGESWQGWLGKSLP